MKRIIILILLISIISFLIMIYGINYDKQEFEEYTMKNLSVRIPTRIDWNIHEFSECPFKNKQNHINCLSIEKNGYEILIVDYGDINTNETLWLTKDEYSDTQSIAICNSEFIRPNYKLNIDKEDPSYISLILYKQEYWLDYMIATSFIKYNNGLFRILYRIPSEKVQGNKIINDDNIKKMDEILTTLEFI